MNEKDKLYQSKWMKKFGLTVNLNWSSEGVFFVSRNFARVRWIGYLRFQRQLRESSLVSSCALCCTWTLGEQDVSYKWLKICRFTICIVLLIKTFKTSAVVSCTNLGYIAPATSWLSWSYHATVRVSVGLITEHDKVADFPDCMASPTALNGIVQLQIIVGTT